MTISTTNSVVIVPGNGVMTNFSVNFVMDEASDIDVYLTDAALNTVQLLPSQFSVTINVPGPGQLWGIGGYVTYPVSGTPLALGELLTIVRNVPDTQEVTIQNQGAFYPRAVEQALDILCLEIQQLVYGLSRTIQVPIGIPLSPLQYLQQLIAGMIGAGGSSPFTGNIFTVTVPAYAVQATDVSLLFNATGNAQTVTLPNALTSFGRFLNLKKVDSSANQVSFTGIVDGISGYSLRFLNEAITIQSNGSSWSIF